MKTRRNALLLALAPVVGISSSAMHAQVNQNELAQQILSDNSAQRRIALFEVQKIGVQNTDRELRAAMLAALQQEANVHRQRYYAARRGEALEELQDAELVATLFGSRG